MRTKILVMTAVMAIALAVSGSAFAMGNCGKYCRQGRDHKTMMKEMKKDLNLTADQEKAMEASREAFKVQGKALRAEMKAKHEALKTALSRPGVTKADVAPIVAEINALQSKMTDQRVDGILKIKSILTPEQFIKLEAKREKMFKKHGGRPR